ncbi:hypothetical protein RF11_02648 [Thelohanellus kitauei]|uniref:Uncharacterized protein n=1 Tax=Thelohanellus kitauei TaxID=669202 RepID=A0A0C2I6G9_THEKT|nr:hypothetical protein RF11_02648 [Thelohanellus kitauei]
MDSDKNNDKISGNTILEDQENNFTGDERKLYLRNQELFLGDQTYFVDEWQSTYWKEPSFDSPKYTVNKVSVCCAMNRYCIVYKEINFRPYNTGSFLGYVDKFSDMWRPIAPQRQGALLSWIASHGGEFGDYIKARMLWLFCHMNIYSRRSITNEIIDH